MDTPEVPKKRFWKRKWFLYPVGIFFALNVLVFALVDDKEIAPQATTQPEQEAEQVVSENKDAATTPVTETKTNTPIVAAKTETKPAPAQTKTETTPPIKTETKPAPVATPTPTQTTASSPQSDRASVLAILKANASAKWKDDYQMVKYEYDNQVEAYDWVVAQTKYPDIMASAKRKWGNDYPMVKYMYENQVEAYEWIMAQTSYPDIMAKAKQKWGTDYQMVQYEYENQVEAYGNL